MSLDSILRWDCLDKFLSQVELHNRSGSEKLKSTENIAKVAIKALATFALCFVITSPLLYVGGFSAALAFSATLAATSYTVYLASQGKGIAGALAGLLPK